jgi:hypothetical protein
MCARWLVFLESVALAVLIYCAYVAGNLRFEGVPMGFDEAFDIESRVHYIFWRSYAREALFVLALLWVAAVVLAVFASVRGGRPNRITRYGSRSVIGVAVVLPLASVLAGFVFGLELGLGF